MSGDGMSSDVKPESEREPTPGAGKAAREWVNYRRLKVIGVALPILFILCLELLRFAVAGMDAAWNLYHLIFLLLTILAISSFSFIMFRFIDRAQRQVLKQNRELAARDAVSNAVRGELGVDRIIDVALESLLASSAATEVSITIFASQVPPHNGDDRTYQLRAGARKSSPLPAELGGTAAELVEIPLSTGTALLGRMQLHLPAGASESEGLGLNTLANIGHQLACAIQFAQLIIDLERRNHEGDAFHDILLQISNQGAPADILAAVVGHARKLVGIDEAILCLNEEASRSFRLDRRRFKGGGIELSGSEADQLGNIHTDHLICPDRSSPQWKSSLTFSIPGPVGAFGDLWVAKRADLPFKARDQEFLTALANLAAITLTNFQGREHERQGAILAERERIAREMHDSLAQVLGVTHLRLRALGSREEVKGVPEIAAEVSQLADISEDAYHDVRESILGLRESSRTERGLLESLRAYLAKYSQQCGIKTSLESEFDHEWALSPRTEVQVIRVIQEALTNIRKHSGAGSAIVRITESSGATSFVVEDDGNGFDPGGSIFNRDGFGVFTMRERMGLLNGSLTIDSAPGRGTRVTATVSERSQPRPTSIEVNNVDQ